jgi:hypothetical protein
MSALDRENERPAVSRSMARPRVSPRSTSPRTASDVLPEG